MNHLQHRTMGSVLLGPVCGAVPALMTVLTMALPTSAFAQTMTMADLVGSWARQDEKEVRATFRPDSTVTVLVEKADDETKGIGTGRWRLAGDTLVVTNFMVNIKGKKEATSVDRRVLALKGKLLTMTKAGDPDAEPQAYERVDTLKVAPLKP